MEKNTCSSSSSSSSSSFAWWASTERLRESCSSAVSAVIYKLFYAIFTFLFAVAGATLGAIIGVFVGLKTEYSFLYGAIIGAIKGGVFSTEIFKFSLSFWHSDDSAISCFLHFIETAANLLSGRFIHHGLSMTMQSALQSQVHTTNTTYNEVPRACDKEAWDSLDKIPKIRITIVDTLWHTISCSVCLQDFQVGDMVRSLPHCHHMFHPPCIDKWLSGHRSCPLCRRTL